MKTSDINSCLYHCATMLGIEIRDLQVIGEDHISITVTTETLRKVNTCYILMSVDDYQSKRDSLLKTKYNELRDSIIITYSQEVTECILADFVEFCEKAEELNLWLDGKEELGDEEEYVALKSYIVC